VADQEQLKIRDYQAGMVTKHTAYSQLDVRLLGEGDYSSICGFLERIAQLPRVKTVQRMQITGSESRAVYPLDVTLTLYFAADNISTRG
jgi:Tfp pilus assembly protein PilO